MFFKILYILDINPMSDKIFAHSMGYLFILVIISFDV
jgi:hypothetical protein